MNSLRIEENIQACSLNIEEVLQELQQTGFRYSSAVIEAIDADAPDDEVIEIYRDPIEFFMNKHEYEFVEVIKLSTNSRSNGAYVYKSERDAFETRLITHGQCSLFLRFQGQIVELQCKSGDMIHIPSTLCYWLEGGMHDCRYIHLYMTGNGWDKPCVRQNLQPCAAVELKQAS